jgi:hypothetical protein
MAAGAAQKDPYSLAGTVAGGGAAYSPGYLFAKSPLKLVKAYESYSMKRS